MILTCEHCHGTKLKEQKGISGTLYLCPKCGCKYRLMIAVNDRDCWNKRFPVKPIIKVKKEKKKKK
jgi:hypothetical protein